MTNDFSRASFDKEKHVFISLNDFCNRRCTYCYLSEEKLSTSTPVETEVLYGNLARLYKDHEFRLVTIAGGEPGLVSDLPKIVEAIAGMGYSIIINTNGALGSRRIKEIHKFNIRAISFSLDSHDKSVNDRLRFHGSWDLVQKGIIGCKEAGLPVRVSAVICRLNRHDVAGLFEWCNGKGVEVLNIHELDTSVNAQFLAPLKLSPAEWRGLVGELAASTRDGQHATALRMPVSYITERESKRIAANKLSCPAVHNDTLCVSPDLSVYRCPLLINRQRVSYKKFDDSLRTRPVDGLIASDVSAQCPLSEQDVGDGSGLIEACKLVKLTINRESPNSNTPIWSDILKQF